MGYQAVNWNTTLEMSSLGNYEFEKKKFLEFQEGVRTFLAIASSSLFPVEFGEKLLKTSMILLGTITQSHFI